MSSSHPATSSHFEDLEWTAFQYVAGELSDQDCQAFEERLEMDQVAREAVVRAVELAQITAVALARSHECAVAARGGSAAPVASYRRVLALAAAACVALALIFIPDWPDLVKELPEDGHASSATEMHDLALAWASAREELSAEPRRVSDDSAAVPVSVLSVEFSELNEDIETPSWMLVAVAGEIEDSEDELPAIEEPGTAL